MWAMHLDLTVDKERNHGVILFIKIVASFIAYAHFA